VHDDVYNTDVTRGNTKTRRMKMKTRNEGWNKGYEMAIASWAAAQCAEPVKAENLPDLELVEEAKAEELPDLDLI